MKNRAALSISVPYFALALATLSACSAGASTGFGSPDASAAPDTGTPLPTFSAGTTVESASSTATASTSVDVSSGTGSSSIAASSSSTSESSAGGSSASASEGATSGNPGDPEPADMVGMTAAHNAARAAVKPVATPSLPTVSWSSTIAASAQAFTTKCVFADTTDSYGSNAFAGTGDYTPADVVDSWVGEDADYDYATNTCEAGQMCGHYTQVVWRGSVEIGCGMTNCTINNPFNGGGHGAWQLWVCNYNPAGNYVGEKPY